MPENQNTNEPQTKKEKVSKIVTGALQKALVRTFRSDIVKYSGENNPEELKKLLPTENGTAPIKKQPPQKYQEENEAVVHTLKDDVQDLVRNKKMSMVRMAALESEKRNIEASVKKRNPWKITMFASLTVLFIITGAVVIAGGYYAYLLNTSTETTTTFESNILFAEDLQRIDVSERSGRSILTTLSLAVDRRPAALGTITELYVSYVTADEPVRLTAMEFLSRATSNTPPTFMQTLDPDYMIGMYTTDDGNMPFVVLKTNSYSYAFTGMLDWERSIVQDLSPLMSRVALPTTEQFEDTVVQNLDVRVLGGMRNPKMLYSFINRSTIVITTDVRTLLEVANRVRIQR
tara:strand:+ start:17571 stop:18611 length:1041 start_codon:yes stop_codon:yes gene_type:complete